MTTKGSSSETPRRVGLMIPSVNTVMEPDFYRNVPAGWTVHTARMYLESTDGVGESRMLDERTLPAARDLATARRELGQALALVGGEDASRLLLYGGGFSRESMQRFCQAQLAQCGGQP